MITSKQQRLKPHFVGEWVVIRSRSYYIVDLRCYRRNRNIQERSIHQLHKLEYRHIHKLKFRPKRGKAFAYVMLSAHTYTKSWKHNSRRRKQWYRTNDI